VGVVSRSCTGNSATADSSKGGATRATLAANSSLLQGQDTTALWNAKTLQTKDTTWVKAQAGNASTLQTLDTTAIKSRSLPADGKAVDATGADSASLADSAKVAGNAHTIQTKDTTWVKAQAGNAATLQTLDTTALKSRSLPVDGKATTAGTADSAIAIPDSILGVVLQLPRVRSHVMPRCTTIANPAAITPDAMVFDQYNVTGLAQTLTIGAPTGSPLNGQRLTIRIKDDGTTRTLSWNAAFVAYTDVTLSTGTTAGKTMYWQALYNSTATKWDVLASQVEP